MRSCTTPQTRMASPDAELGIRVTCRPPTSHGYLAPSLRNHAASVRLIPDAPPMIRTVSGPQSISVFSSFLRLVTPPTGDCHWATAPPSIGDRILQAGPSHKAGHGPGFRLPPADSISCAPDVHQELEFKHEGPRDIFLGPSYPTGYGGGRRWFRTTDPLLVRQVLSP